MPRQRGPVGALPAAWSFAIVSWLALALVIVTPWPFRTSMRHFAAAFGCDASNAVGLAGATPGQPGYWPWLDRRHDGIACERDERHAGITTAHSR